MWLRYLLVDVVDRKSVDGLCCRRETLLPAPKNISPDSFASYGSGKADSPVENVLNYSNEQWVRLYPFLLRMWRAQGVSEINTLDDRLTTRLVALLSN